MDQIVYHVVPNGEGWAVKKEGNEQASRVTDDRDDAVKAARAFARRQAPSRVIVHRADGAIEDQQTFEHAPPSRHLVRDHKTAAILLGVTAGVVLAAAVSGLVWYEREYRR